MKLGNIYTEPLAEIKAQWLNLCELKISVPSSLSTALMSFRYIAPASETEV